MGERHRYEPPCPEHRRGFDDELHCQLQRRAFGAVEPLLIAPVEFEIAPAESEAVGNRHAMMGMNHRLPTAYLPTAY